MTNSPSITAQVTDQEGIVPTKGKTVLKVVGYLFIAAAIVSLVFGILGILGIGLTDTFYLESAINEAGSISKNLEGEAMWTDESWDVFQEKLVNARETFNDRMSTQEQIDAALLGLRQGIDSLVLTEAFSQIELDEFLPDGRSASVFFTYLIIFFLILGAIGFIAIKFCADIEKTRMLGVCGIIGFVATALFIILAVEALGADVFFMFLPSLILPVAYLVGTFKNDRRVSAVITFSILVLLATIVLFPLFWIIRTSLMYLHEVFSMAILPPSWRFSNYPRALETFKYFTYLRNTFIIAVPSVVLGTCTAILCAYSFARLSFRFKKFVFGLCIASMLLPSVVTLIPLFIMFTNFFGLSNTFWPLIIPWICGGGAFNIFLMRQFIMTIPRELDEAAMIDGAGRLRILVQIIIPAIKPAIMVVGIFIFMLIWNDMLTQLVYLQSEELHTMAIGLRVFTGSYGTDWPLTMVATVLSIIPGLLIYIFGQKYLVEGIVMTGMKN